MSPDVVTGLATFMPSWNPPPTKSDKTYSSHQHYLMSQQDNEPWHTANTAQRNTIKGPRCWPGLHIPQIPNRSSICKTCWSRSDPLKAPPPNMQDPEHPWCHHRTPSVVIMLRLIGVYIKVTLRGTFIFWFWPKLVGHRRRLLSSKSF